MLSGPPLPPATVEQIVSVFQAASKQKAWDHFSKAQRKNLDVWRKQAEVGILYISLFYLFMILTYLPAFIHGPLDRTHCVWCLLLNTLSTILSSDVPL